jgi:diguanylate cyclase (GGDEF)-like protein
MRSAIGWLATRFAAVTQRRLRPRALPCIVVGVVAFMGLAAIIGFFADAEERGRLREYRYATRDVLGFQQALTDVGTGVRGFVLSQRIEYLEPYANGIKVLNEMAPVMLPRLDRFDATRPNRQAGTMRPSDALRILRTVWQTAMYPAPDDPLTPAAAIQRVQRAKEMVEGLRGVIASYVGDRNAAAEEAEQRLAVEQGLLLVIYPLGALTAIIATTFAFWRGGKDAQARENARHEMEQLFGMASMLQSAIDRDDANHVLRGKAQYLLPGFSGALYVFNNSRDRLDWSTGWGHLLPQDSAGHIAPTECWALKLGKPYLNGGRGNLSCQHDTPNYVVLEIPMAARGEIFGLLQVAHDGADAEAHLESIRPLAVALADAMSLSLSSSALREQLRNQALRDGLTGLYNRRFLEEMLGRLTQDAERRGVPMSAIMIDLDHFKRLNDQFGHGAGDTVLREVARVIMASLRATDVACRYGGEELLVLLPDCALDTAVQTAERLRIQIEALSDVSKGQSVTASFGVASAPETTARPGELMAVADTALYQAKKLGRNRVEVATRQSPRPSHVSLVPPI